MLKALGEEGLSKEQSYRMVKVLLAERNVFMRTFQEKVFGLGSAEINQPFKAALVMGFSFIVGAIIPIVPFIAMGGSRGALPVGFLERGYPVSASAPSKAISPASPCWFPVQSSLASP